MLKLHVDSLIQDWKTQPPSGGCVLKPKDVKEMENLLSQPPSGGCVLKQSGLIFLLSYS